ncbi:MAG: MFS transporter [Rhizobiales bacterium]|nr:MFS transporter [Hyphomicrobiales bacterium]
MPITLIPLLVAAGILLAGNGLQGTLITLRGTAEGFSPLDIGMIGAGYSTGFLLACIYAPRLLQSVGHIRTFAALAALSAVGTLMMVMVIDQWLWMAIRFVVGFCFSGLFTTIESWINSKADKNNRGRVLSFYRIIDLLAVTGGQFLIPAFGVMSFAIFSVAAMLYCLSIVPISLSDRSRPEPPENFHFDLKAVWAISPLACFGCFTIGLTNSAFRLVGPLYAQDVGFDETGIATFMSAGIAGGILLQYPLGWISDRFSRRVALMIATLGAIAAGLVLSAMGGTSQTASLIGIFAFGAFAMPLYSLSAAHANDQAGDDQYVLVAAGLMFFFSSGAIGGPFFAAIFAENLGAPAMFLYTSIVHGMLVIFTIFRAIRRPGLEPRADRRFVALIRTSPQFLKLAMKANRSKDDAS